MVCEGSEERDWAWFMEKGNAELEHCRGRKRALGFARTVRRHADTDKRRRVGQSRI